MAPLQQPRPSSPQAQPLHRAAGWWCAGQSALPSLAYFFFSLRAGGAASLWQACFPASLPDGSLVWLLNTRAGRFRWIR